MEAVVVAAFKETALSASVAAAAAEEEAAAAAAADKEAAATASASALTAKEAASVAATALQAASAAALNAKEAEDILATVAEEIQASKKRKFHFIDDGGSVDLISRLRDDELRIIVSLLPTKEGARTQVISRRWRPIWRSAPLKQLTLERVTISEDALQSMLSGFSALESLELKNNFGFRRLCVSSQTLKSIGFCTTWRKASVLIQELVIVDTPCLERFLELNPSGFSPIIRIISAPKLKILGMLSEDIPELNFGTTVFKEFNTAVSLTTKMHTMRVLVLDSHGPNLDRVINFLKCFPCLESLYVIFHSGPRRDNVRQYDPLDPIECLELHLKKVVLKNYNGIKSESVEFTKFLVLNAKVLKEMKIRLPYHGKDRWFANQRNLLQIRNRASKDAQIELKCGITDNFRNNRHTHDLSMADPFDIPSRGCFCGPF